MGVTESRQKGQEGYHLPQIRTHPEDGAAMPPHGVRHYLTSVDTGQLPTARHTPFNWFICGLTQKFRLFFLLLLFCIAAQKHSKNTHRHTFNSLTWF